MRTPKEVTVALSFTIVDRPVKFGTEKFVSAVVVADGVEVVTFKLSLDEWTKAKTLPTATVSGTMTQSPRTRKKKASAMTAKETVAAKGTGSGVGISAPATTTTDTKGGL